MKFEIFLGIVVFIVGCEVGWIANAELRTRSMKRYAETNNDIDVAKMCHVVTHQSSDGFSYWSCDENR